MRLDQSFTVPVPVEEAWRVLLDLPRIAPCMPGATVTGVDGDTFTGTVKVRLGPITLTYQGQGRFVERDEAARRVVLEARGKDVRAAGTAAATVTAVLSAAGDTTNVDVVTDLTITGRPAQFGRGMIGEVSGKLLGQFADCLADTLGQGDSPAGTAPADTDAAVAEPAATEPAATEPAPSPTASPTPVPTATPTATPAPGEVEPVDLLRVAGSTDTVRRAAWGGLGALVLAALAWLVIRWLRD
jgi:carbon monoxide dehydrogenase subunit G